MKYLRIRDTAWRYWEKLKMFLLPRLGIRPVNPELVKRIKEEKARRLFSPFKYHDQPKLAFIVHSFNRVSNVDQLVTGLRRMGDHELIVCEDGSLDGSHEKWMSYLQRPNNFLIHSNDLHEIRISDRAIRFSSAEIVCIVQDDDRIPRKTNWLKAALKQFEVNPRLAIIGGFMGFPSFYHLLPELPHPSIPKRIWGPAPFQFVHYTNIGPFFIRKKHYEALGGWDYSFSKPGEPGIGFEVEICLRAWLKGYQVGYSFVPFKGPPGHYSLDGGTMLFSDKVRIQNQRRNLNKVIKMYKKHIGQIDRLVMAANRRTGLPRYHSTGYKKGENSTKVILDE